MMRLFPKGPGLSRPALARTISLLFVVMLFALYPGVGHGAETEPSKAKAVCVIWNTKSRMAESIAKGLEARMGEIAPDVELRIHGKQAGMEIAEPKFRECEASADGIVFLRSDGAAFLAAQKPRVPCFVGSCEDPVKLGVLKNSDAPEGMVTGVTYYIPYKKRFQVIRAFLPSVQNVGFLFEAGHPGGLIQRQGTRDECQLEGLGYHEVEANDLQGLLAGVQDLVSKVDVIILSDTLLAMDNVSAILYLANPAKVPLFSYAEGSVKRGATFGMAADDVKLGRMLAESVVDVVVKGKPVSEVPVKTDPEPHIIVNTSMMKALGLTIPEELAKKVVVVE